MKRRINISNTRDFLRGYFYGLLYSGLVIASLCWLVYRFSIHNGYLWPVSIAVVFFAAFIYLLGHRFIELAKYPYGLTVSGEHYEKFCAMAKARNIPYDDFKSSYDNKGGYSWRGKMMYLEDCIEAKLAFS